ncbi:MAG: UDP-glucose 4-epimerase GalE [Chloroflexi bacterium]|nr:UDP-glucose 4-epimerase GalE [Chloroflexota bacterium]
MRLLVTGGAGYVGGHTVRALLKAGHEVLVYDNLVYGHAETVPCELVVGELADAAGLDAVLGSRHFDAVLHFAAYAYVGESVQDPAKYWRNNVSSGIELLDAMRRHGVNQIVFSSTCATYGYPDSVPVTEDEPKKPESPYGESKLTFERVLASYAQAYDLRSVSLRYFNAAGAAADGTLGEDHEPETHLIPLVLAVAAGRLPHVKVFGTDYPTPDGTCIRDYIHVEDLASAHVLAVGAMEERGACKAYNLGTGTGYSVREIIDACRRVTGREIAVVEEARRPGDATALFADNRKIRNDLGWSPRYETVEQIVATAWRWHAKRWGVSS